MRSFLVACFALSVLTTLYAGGTPLYTDYKPECKPIKDNYSIDKIEYFEDEMVIHFRFIATPKGGWVTYYGYRGSAPWYLKNDTSSYTLQVIRNITEDGKVLVELMNYKPFYRHEQIPNGVYTCEIVFKRLPADVKKVDLIEGKGYESETSAFNVFNIVIKDIKSKNLGTEKDMRKRIDAIKKTSSQ